MAIAVGQSAYSRIVNTNKNRNGYQNLMVPPGSGENATESQARKDRHYYFLSLPGFCLLFSIVLHSPYIISAYLMNDAQHAGSIFFFYVSLTFVEFGLLQFSFNRCLEVDDNQKNEESPISAMRCGAISAITTPLLLYGLTVVIMLYFHFVPTNDSISSIPNQIVVSYQMAILLVGAYVAYVSVFKKKSSLQRALRDTHADWKSLTDEDVLTKFYKEMISMSNEMISKSNEIANTHKLQNKIIISWRKYDHQPDEAKKSEIHEQITMLENEMNG